MPMGPYVGSTWENEYELLRQSFLGHYCWSWVADWSSYSDALTVYRIGGNNLPPPELAAEDGVDFVQLNHF